MMAQGVKDDLGQGAKGIQVREQAEAVEIVLPGGEHFKVASSHVQRDVVGLYLADSAPIEFFFGSYNGKAVGEEIIVPPAVLQRINAKR